MPNKIRDKNDLKSTIYRIICSTYYLTIKHNYHLREMSGEPGSHVGYHEVSTRLLLELLVRTTPLPRLHKLAENLPRVPDQDYTNH